MAPTARLAFFHGCGSAALASDDKTLAGAPIATLVIVPQITKEAKPGFAAFRGDNRRVARFQGRYMYTWNHCIV
jgi:hypothetical protein